MQGETGSASGLLIIPRGRRKLNKEKLLWPFYLKPWTKRGMMISGHQWTASKLWIVCASQTSLLVPFQLCGMKLPMAAEAMMQGCLPNCRVFNTTHGFKLPQRWLCGPGMGSISTNSFGISQLIVIHCAIQTFPVLTTEKPLLLEKAQHPPAQGYWGGMEYATLRAHWSSPSTSWCSRSWLVLQVHWLISLISPPHSQGGCLYLSTEESTVLFFLTFGQINKTHSLQVSL